MKVCVIAVLLITSSSIVGCHEQAPSSDTSASDSPIQKVNAVSSDIFLNAHGDRQPDGTIVIFGKTNLPDGLKMWVEIESGHLPLGAPRVVANDEAVFVNNGSFQTAPLWLEVPNTTFPKKGWPASVKVDVRQKSLPQGPNKVHFESFFNTAWQTDAVLAVIGNNEGKNLKGAILKATDSDVSDSPKVLDFRQTMAFSASSSEARAISLVRGSILTVPGEGRSTGDVQANIDLYLASPGMTMEKGWSARVLNPNNLEVSYDFVDGSQGEEQAIWKVNLTSRSVQYVDEAAKLFSWTPKD